MVSLECTDQGHSSAFVGCSQLVSREGRGSDSLFLSGPGGEECQHLGIPLHLKDPQRQESLPLSQKAGQERSLCPRQLLTSCTRAVRSSLPVKLSERRTVPGRWNILPRRDTAANATSTRTETPGPIVPQEQQPVARSGCSLTETSARHQEKLAAEPSLYSETPICQRAESGNLNRVPAGQQSERHHGSTNSGKSTSPRARPAGVGDFLIALTAFGTVGKGVLPNNGNQCQRPFSVLPDSALLSGVAVDGLTECCTMRG